MRLNTYLKVGLVGGVLILLGITTGFLIFPTFLKHKISNKLALKKDSEIRKLYTKVPFPLEFKIYIFNVTNSLAVQKGESPVVDEIGPYVFEEWREKENVVDNDTDDTLTYNSKITWIFDQKSTGKLTMDEIITIPHPLILGMALRVAKEKPSMLSFLNKAITSIYSHPDSVFLTAPVKDILFDGIVINCTVKDFAGKAICSLIKKEGKDLQQIAEDVYKFSFFGQKNGTADPRRFKVMRGIKNIRDVGRVVEHDDQTELKVWSTKECNKFRGTDSTIFPPFLDKKDGLVSYSPDLCRSLSAKYVETVSYNGIAVNVYNASLGDMSHNEAEKCFCPTPDTCMRRGAMELSKCQGAPVIVTLPHFYDCDPYYLETVRGLHPDKDKHSVSILFEPMTGSPLAARNRLQFNIPLKKVEKISLMKDLPESVLPMFWVEESIILNSTYTSQLESLFTSIYVISIFKWTLISVGCTLVVVALILHYKHKVKLIVAPANSINNNNSLHSPKSNFVNTVTESISHNNLT